MQTHTHVTYSFEELSEEAQEKALEKYYDWNVNDDFWHECIIDDAKKIGKLVGIEIKNIYFSGFSNQGDGACFEGYYEYKNGGLKALKEYAPQDKKLHRIAENLEELQRKNFYRLSASVKHSGHYYHEHCTRIEVYYEDYDDDAANPEYWYYRDNKPDEALKDILRDFMRWIYKRLESEYDYLTSEENLREYFSDSDYIEFDENGTIH